MQQNGSKKNQRHMKYTTERSNIEGVTSLKLHFYCRNFPERIGTFRQTPHCRDQALHFQLRCFTSSKSQLRGNTHGNIMKTDYSIGGEAQFIPVKDAQWHKKPKTFNFQGMKLSGSSSLWVP